MEESDRHAGLNMPDGVSGGENELVFSVPAGGGPRTRKGCFLICVASAGGLALASVFVPLGCVFFAVLAFFGIRYWVYGNAEVLVLELDEEKKQLLVYRRGYDEDRGGEPARSAVAFDRIKEVTVRKIPLEPTHSSEEKPLFSRPVYTHVPIFHLKNGRKLQTLVPADRDQAFCGGLKTLEQGTALAHRLVRAIGLEQKEVSVHRPGVLDYLKVSSFQVPAIFLGGIAALFFTVLLSDLLGQI